MNMGVIQSSEPRKINLQALDRVAMFVDSERTYTKKVTRVPHNWKLYCFCSACLQNPKPRQQATEIIAKMNCPLNSASLTSQDISCCLELLLLFQKYIACGWYCSSISPRLTVYSRTIFSGSNFDFHGKQSSLDVLAVLKMTIVRLPKSLREMACGLSWWAVSKE